ncbi:UDP-N-acetylglucosamine 1-carboxyvinyltransferase, partial [Candidatus Gracilibacteria bacterium]|nr:UDP-N-acetylglucosamine 1-carboxyvinyltransferase [Candidatus Gracilibacteria bacterium]
LEKKITNPHEAEITGKAMLEGNTVTSWDLRAGCAVVIAGLIAKGQTDVTNIAYIKRGYEDFVDNLQELGADIEEIVA